MNVVREHLTQMLQTCATMEFGDPELEVRVGTWRDDGFVPGVSKVVFDQMEMDMSADPALTTTGTWTEVIDYKYVHEGQTVRTRVVADTDEVQMKIEHACKKTLQSFTVANDDGDYCRIQLSRETRVENVPERCTPVFVRIQQRKTFYAKSWRYDLSRTYAGCSRTIAETRRASGDARYEVECEMLPNAFRHVPSDLAVTSVCARLAGLMGYETMPTLTLKTHPPRHTQRVQHEFASN